MVTITVSDLTSGRYLPKVYELGVEASYDTTDGLETMLDRMLRARRGIFQVEIYYSDDDGEGREEPENWYLLFASKQNHGGKLRVVIGNQPISENLRFLVYRIPAKKSGDTYVYHGDFERL